MCPNKMATRKFFAVVPVVFIIAASAGVAALAAYFHIMLPAANILLSDPGARTYSIDEKYLLLVWRNHVFLPERSLGRITI